MSTTNIQKKMLYKYTNEIKKKTRSMYGTLSVCGFVINVTPLEPVTVWAPLDCKNICTAAADL